jgi:hypothetical protein
LAGQAVRAEQAGFDADCRSDHLAQLGTTAVVVMNISGRDPDGMLDIYGKHVLPQLRGE